MNRYRLSQALNSLYHNQVVRPQPQKLLILSQRPLRHYCWLPIITHIPSQRCYISLLNKPSCSTLKYYYSTKSGNDLNFSNHSVVFRHKTFWELLRGLLVLYICGVDTLVKHSYKLLRLGEKILGTWLLGKLVSPFYWQFVAGDSETEMAKASANLRQLNINLMIAPMIETDVGEGYQNSSQYEKNMEKTIHLVNVAGRQGKTNYIPICQTKHTAHLPADVLARITTTYEALTPDQRLEAVKSVSKVIRGLRQNVNSNNPDLQILNLNKDDYNSLVNSLHRFYKIGEQCISMKVTLAVDAEYTYTNPAISLITLAMMDNFNHTRAVVWNTYQGLLKNTMGWLQHDLEIADKMNFKFGAKIVRGAYLDKERQLASGNNYPDPTNPTYEATSQSYDSLVNLLGRKVSSQPGKYTLMVASHNEASVRKAVDLYESLSPVPEEGQFVFGQVYGMADNISVPLAAAGYQVYKSIPYGNMDEVLPYLSRRASENRAVFKGVRRERALLSQQLISRMKLRSK